MISMNDVTVAQFRRSDMLSRGDSARIVRLAQESTLTRTPQPSRTIVRVLVEGFRTVAGRSGSAGPLVARAD